MRQIAGSRCVVDKKKMYFNAIYLVFYQKRFLYISRKIISSEWGIWKLIVCPFFPWNYIDVILSNIFQELLVSLPVSGSSEKSTVWSKSTKGKMFFNDFPPKTTIIIQ